MPRRTEALDTLPQVYAIKVPPGNYAMQRWAVFAWGLNERVLRRKFDETSKFSEPFSVESGAVVFLGDFVTTHQAKVVSLMSSDIKYQIIPQAITVQAARDIFSEAYPGFKGADFSCRLCSFGGPSGRETYRFVSP